MTIHEKINLRSYFTSYLKGGRFKLPYRCIGYVCSHPRFYFNSSKRVVFNFKK
jgi:hypothetical protein